MRPPAALRAAKRSSNSTPSRKRPAGKRTTRRPDSKHPAVGSSARTPPGSAPNASRCIATTRVFWPIVPDVASPGGEPQRLVGGTQTQDRQVRSRRSDVRDRNRSRELQRLRGRKMSGKSRPRHRGDREWLGTRSTRASRSLGGDRRRRPCVARSVSVKAAVVLRYGSPDVLEVRDVKTPAPGQGELLIRWSEFPGLVPFQYNSGGSPGETVFNAIGNGCVTIFLTDQNGNIQSSSPYTRKTGNTLKITAITALDVLVDDSHREFEARHIVSQNLGTHYSFAKMTSLFGIQNRRRCMPDFR